MGPFKKSCVQQIIFTNTGDDNGEEGGEGSGGGGGGGKKKAEKKIFMVQEIETKLTEQQARLEIATFVFTP